MPQPDYDDLVAIISIIATTLSDRHYNTEPSREAGFSNITRTSISSATRRIIDALNEAGYAIVPKET